MAHTLLLADNDLDYLETASEYFEKLQFNVRKASNPAEAKVELEKGGIDVAILDIRLVNNKDKNDFSGVRIARTVAIEVPKILLTEWPTYEAAATSLGSSFDGLPRPVACVTKKAGLPALLTAVRNTLEFDLMYRVSSDNLALKLDLDYKDARQQSLWNYRVGLGIAILGAIFIIVGAYLALQNKNFVSALIVLAGVISEMTTVLFFKRIDSSNERMDRYHLEMMETRRLEILLAACNELPAGGMREQRKDLAITTATTFWLGSESKMQNPLMVSKRSIRQEPTHEKEGINRGQ